MLPIFSETKEFFRRNLFMAFVAILVGVVPVWWLNDRELPYDRESGEIIAVDPTLCGFNAGSRPTVLGPGACVSTKWKITPHKNCKPAGRYNVTREIHNPNLGGGKDRIELPSSDSIYSIDKSIESNITRYFPLPFNLPNGKNTYVSSACFVCNPLQEMFPKALAVCVNKPDIDFWVGDPPVMGPC